MYIRVILNIEQRFDESEMFHHDDKDRLDHQDEDPKNKFAKYIYRFVFHLTYKTK